MPRAHFFDQHPFQPPLLGQLLEALASGPEVTGPALLASAVACLHPVAAEDAR